MANPYDPYEQKIIGLEQQKRFAEKLREQALTPQQGQMVSGWYVHPGIAGALVQGLKGYIANKKEREAEQGIKDVMGERQRGREAWMGQMPQATTTTQQTPFQYPQMEGEAPIAGLANVETKTKQPTAQDFLAWGMKGSQFDPSAMTTGAAFANLAEGEKTREENRDFQRQQLQEKIADARLSRAERAAAEERLARIQMEGRSDIARLTAALRPAPQPQAPVAVIGPNGEPTFVSPGQAVGMRPAKGAEEKPLTEFQGKSTTFGTRTAQSHNILKELEDNVNPLSVSASQTGGALTNWALAPETQRVAQAQRDFVNAVLRQESGASISSAEFENAKKQYFPQPGDSEDVKTQKRLNREMVIKGFARQAGPGGRDVNEVYNAGAPKIGTPGEPSQNQPPALPTADAIAAELARRRGRP